MPTITWYRSEPQPQVLTFRPAGDPLTGASAEVVIAGSVHIPLTPVADGFEWDLADVPPSLPSRTWRAALIITWPDSSIDRDDFLFRIRDSYPQQTDRITAIEVAGQEWRRPPPPPVPPSNTAMPVIDITGNDWSITPGTWDNADSVATVVTLGGDPVGLTGTIAEADDGKTLLVVETATNADGSAEVQVSEVVAWVDPLETYYGTGPGQVAIDLQFNDPTAMSVDGNGRILSLTNRGGAGAYFDLTASAGSGPLQGSGYTQFADGAGLTFANMPDAIGVHLLLAIYPSVTPTDSNKMLVEASGQGGIYYTQRNSGTALDWRYYNGSTGVLKRIGTDLEAWHLAEIRFSDGNVYLIWDGALVHTGAISDVSFLLAKIGGGLFRGKLLRSVNMICDAAVYDHNAPEPAITAARQRLNDQIAALTS